MPIFDAIGSCQVRLEDLALEPLGVDPADIPAVRGAVAELMTKRMLLECGIMLDTDFPRRVNGYVFEQHDGHVIVRDSTTGRHVHEYDFLVRSPDGAPGIVEVKALKLRGIESKLLRGARIASELYGRSVETIIFFPAYGNKQEDRARLERMPLVRCVDLGYKKKQLERFVARYGRP